MSYLDPRVYDNGLSVLPAEVTDIHICTTLPVTYAEAIAASLGSKASPTISAPEAGVPNGRQVTISAFVDGVVATGGTAGFVAAVDTVNSRLLYARALAGTQAVTLGVPFPLSSHVVRIPAPAGV